MRQQERMWEVICISWLNDSLEHDWDAEKMGSSSGLVKWWLSGNKWRIHRQDLISGVAAYEKHNVY